jgi:hypothetical protein
MKCCLSAATEGLYLMRRRSKFISFLFLVACLKLSLSLPNGLAADLLPSIDIPVFLNGVHIKKEIDRSSATKSISYRLQTKFSAAEVLEFYDSYFNAKGWRPSFEICQRHWARLPDEKKSGGPSVKQLFTSWEHPKLHLKAVLRLEYEMINKKWGDELVVRCQLQPKDG